MTERILLPPKPSNEIKTLRKIGYTLATSICDILDNSIAAKAKNISISIPLNDKSEPFIKILDDGGGMSREELINNMRLGCKDPDATREKGDLGRFGSGMKTASFSQAKKLTVVSKKKNKPLNAATWDIDRIEMEDEWILEMFTENELMERQDININKNLMNIDGQGTQVVWQSIDRYQNKDKEPDWDLGKILAEDITNIKRTIAVYFHRFLEPDQNDKNEIDKIRIMMNGVSIKPIDPFMKSYKGYEEGGRDHHRSRHGTVNISIHNIPHPDKLSKSDLDDIGGLENYNSRQGFYIYRDKRLIIEGDWLKTNAAGILGNRARIQVDVPSSMDHVWGTDVKKETFQFPPAVLRKFKSLALAAIGQSKRDYKRRGNETTRENEFWDIITTPKNNSDQYQYVISHKNKDIKSIIKKIDKISSKKLTKYLIDMSNYLPLQHIMFTMGNKPDTVKKYDNVELLYKQLKSDDNE